jgi:hypothetical protein
MPSRTSRFAIHQLVILASLPLIPLAANSQSSDAACQNGAGGFAATSSTGVAVFVGTRKVEGFGSRDCQSILRWKDQELVAVPHAWQLDVDAMDINLGLSAPVLTLQMKATEVDRTSTYQIYSLKQPPELLREITGGDTYAAADTNMDGHVAIWTHDAQAIDGLEHIPLSSFDYPPTVVLRFEKRRLLDAQSEFTAEFDRQIAAIKTQLNPRQLSSFKAGDGTLAATPASAVDELHALMTAKIGILEIVFAYLYSGREDQAWHTLRDLWPDADYDRIRAAIAAARAHGMLRQVDGVDEGAGRSRAKHEIVVYQAPPEKAKTNHEPSPPPMPSAMGRESNVTSGSNVSLTSVADSPPVPIHLYMKTEGDNGDAPLVRTMMLNLIIDDAGKVRSVQFNGSPDKRIKDASANWRFIPAFKFGHAVACQMNFEIASSR